MQLMDWGELVVVVVLLLGQVLVLVLDQVYLPLVLLCARQVNSTVFGDHLVSKKGLDYSHHQ